jgi:signal transduction histidine kinase
MKHKPSRYLVPALLLLAAVIVALNAWFAFRAVEALLRSEGWVEHTWQTINQVERVMGSAKDAETGSRGYIISGDESYLDPYTTARRELPDELDHLKSLIAGDPGQLSRLTEMRAVLDERLSLLERGIEGRRSGSREIIRPLILNRTGEIEMNHLRRIVDDMESEERRLLVIRTAEANGNSLRARLMIALASLLDGLFIIFIFRYFMRERAMRVAAELDAERLALARAETERQSEQVRALNATLEQRVKDRTTELEAINHELEAFSYSVSHDLRAPLRTIDGFSLALEEDYSAVVGEVGKDYIRRVRGSVQRMGQLIDALLQLSRITRAEITRERFSLSQLAESVAFNLLEENKGRQITFHIEPGLAAEADPKLLRVALENLFGNAVKFSSKMSSTIIHFGWDKEKNAWFVRDNGAGFDMYYAAKLFTAFHRLHGDKDFKGSGIGLATVARVIHRHHGTIWADSVVDNGATFWFTLR